MDAIFDEQIDTKKNPALDVTSRAFQPKRFVRKALADVSHDVLETQLVDEIHAAEGDAGEALKQLLRDNLGTFIESKDAMDAVYTSDKTLFTGEALDDITAAFRDTEDGCGALVNPTLETYKDVQQSKISQDILAKLFSVLSVPGTVYQLCGVRAALSQSLLKKGMNDEDSNKDSSKGRGKNKKDPSGAAADGQKDSPDGDDRGADAQEEEEEEEEEEEDEEDEEDGFAAPDANEMVRGALEEPMEKDLQEKYVLEPGEEVFMWYGTPLVRLKNVEAQRHRVEEVSNFEAATLNLRRAMLYMEEKYDLEKAVVKDADEYGADVTSSISRFIFNYAMALLRSSLYLNQQLAEELSFASASDTVLIEDTLSMMMDVSIATVKLRHFCDVLWATFDKRNENALEGLRNKLEEGQTGEDPLGRAATTESFADTLSSPQLDDDESAASFSRGETAQVVEEKKRSKLRHPVEYFIGLIQNEHTGLMFTSAAALSRESSDWKQKAFVTSQEAQRIKTEEDARRQTLVKEAIKNSTFTLDGNATYSNLQLNDAMLGNMKDSFSDNTFRFMSVGGSASGGDNLPENEAQMRSMSFSTSNIHVGGFSMDVKSNQAKADGTEHFAKALLEAFRTPEASFEKFTTFKIGKADMGDVFESSCMQMLMHSKSMLKQLAERSDTEATIMSQGALLQTFAARLSESCMLNLEHVVTSYWGGIATAIHSGLFDYNPDPSTPLARMIAEVQGPVVETTGKDAPAHSISAAASTTMRDEDTLSASIPERPAAGISTKSDVPELRFLPVLSQSKKNADGKDMKTLRDFSIDAVRRMVQSASAIMHSLFIAFVNRSVLVAFVRHMSRYTTADVRLNNSAEQIELHAAILLEVIVGQWERIMLQVSESVLRMKVTIGESCSTATLSSEHEMEEVGELLEEMEQLRSTCLRCYFHGVGMVSKAYITLLPFISRSKDASLERRMRARLSRDYVSSILTVKLSNLLSVVMDRTVHFLQRDTEIFDSSDLFAAKEEDAEEKKVAAATGAPAARRRVLRRNRTAGSSDAPDVAPAAAETAPAAMSNDNVDPVTQFMADCHSKLVLDHMSEHEELIQTLAANLFLAFVDMLHLKCQSVCGDTEAHPNDRSKDVVECMADALCLPTTVAPLLLENLIQPCLFDMCAMLTPAAVTAQDKATLGQLKNTAFTTNYLARVNEHCQLVVDAMMCMYLNIPQTRISQEVRRAGFMIPLMDWQRASSHTVASVRSYIPECLAYVAQAHEVLNWIHQPVLGAAVTQKLVSHLANVFVTSLTSNFNAFEFSSDCSSDFFTYGLLLIEAEALVILSVLDTIMDRISKNPKAGGVLPELQEARETLQSVSVTLQHEAATALEILSAQNQPTAMAVGDRNRKRDAIVQAAIEDVKYMVEAISTQLEETSLANALLPQSGVSIAESIASRLAKRTEGYKVQHVARQKPAAKEVKKKKMHKRPTTEVPLDAKSTGRADSPPLPATPRQEEQHPDVIANVLIKAPNEAPKKARHLVRRRRPAAEPAEAPDADADAVVTPPATPLPQPAAAAVVPAAAVGSTPPVPPTKTEAAPLPPRRRPAARRARAAAAEAPPAAEGGEDGAVVPRRQRRAHQFGRTAAL